MLTRCKNASWAGSCTEVWSFVLFEFLSCSSSLLIGIKLTWVNHGCCPHVWPFDHAVVGRSVFNSGLWQRQKVLIWASSKSQKLCVNNSLFDANGYIIAQVQNASCTEVWSFVLFEFLFISQLIFWQNNLYVHTVQCTPNTIFHEFFVSISIDDMISCLMHYSNVMPLYCFFRRWTWVGTQICVV